MVKTKINITDTTRIKSVKPKYPDITSENADAQLKYYHEIMVNAKEALQKAREHIKICESNYDTAKNKFNKMADLFDIEYETITKEHITHTNSFSIQGMGNDILGKMY